MSWIRRRGRDRVFFCISGFEVLLEFYLEMDFEAVVEAGRWRLMLARNKRSGLGRWRGGTVERR